MAPAGRVTAKRSPSKKNRGSIKAKGGNNQRSHPNFKQRKVVRGREM